MKVQKSRTIASKSSIGRQYSSAGAWEKQMGSSNWPSRSNELKPSRSDPSMAPSFSAVPNTAAVVVMIHSSMLRHHPDVFLWGFVLFFFRRTNVPNNKCSCFQKTNGQSYQSSYKSQKSMHTQVHRQSTHSVSNGTHLSVSKTGFIRPPSAQSLTDGKMGTIKIPSKLEQSSA